MTHKSIQTRKSAGRFGAIAEHLAALLLRFKGYQILARQLRSPLGEIDIIAKRGKTLAFVEVKARANTQTALEALSHRQQERIRRAALAFVSDQSSYRQLDLRFDLIAIAPWKMPKHVQNAW